MDTTFQTLFVNADNPLSNYYRVLARLGEGSFGVVSLAQCCKTGRLVAIKRAKRTANDPTGISLDVYREIAVSI